MLSRDFPRLEARGSKFGPIATPTAFKGQLVRASQGRVEEDLHVVIPAAPLAHVVKVLSEIHIVSVDGLAKLEQHQELMCRDGESLEWPLMLFFWCVAKPRFFIWPCLA